MNNIKSTDDRYRFATGHAKARGIFFQAIAFLFIMNALPACNNGASNNQTQNQQNKIDSLTNVKDTLQAENNAARLQLDNYMTKFEQLDSMIKQKDAEITKLKSANGSLANKNKKLAAELKADKKLISSLKNDLSTDSASYENRLGLLENDKNNLLHQKDSLLAAYNHILAIGSVLHASNIRIAAIHLKHSGKEKDTRRARKADGLKIDFDIDENRIAESGMKQIYLVIKDPSGNLLVNTASGSGVTTASNGSQISYSVLKEIPLVTDQPVKDISVEWRQEGDYEKGAYKIYLYNGGYKIGGGEADLK